MTYNNDWNTFELYRVPKKTELNFIPMKRKILSGVLTLMVIAMFNSCDILDIIDIDFTTDGEAVILEIQPAKSGEYYEVFDDIDSDIKEQIEKHGGKIDNLEKVVISDIFIEVESGSKNLNPFKSAKITLETNNIDALDIAWQDDIPLDTHKTWPEHTNENIKELLKESNYTLKLKGDVRESFTETIILKVIVYYNVTL